jgi:hypothetical protein
MLYIPLIPALNVIPTYHAETCHVAWQCLRVVQNWSLKQLAACMAVQQ